MKSEKEIYTAGYLAGFRARPSALVSEAELVNEPNLLEQFMRSDWAAFKLEVPGPLSPMDLRDEANV